MDIIKKLFYPHQFSLMCLKKYNFKNTPRRYIALMQMETFGYMYIWVKSKYRYKNAGNTYKLASKQPRKPHANYFYILLSVSFICVGTPSITGKVIVIALIWCDSDERKYGVDHAITLHKFVGMGITFQ